MSSSPHIHNYILIYGLSSWGGLDFLSGEGCSRGGKETRLVQRETRLFLGFLTSVQLSCSSRSQDFLSRAQASPPSRTPMVEVHVKVLGDKRTNKKRPTCLEATENRKWWSLRKNTWKPQEQHAERTNKKNSRCCEKCKDETQRPKEKHQRWKKRDDGQLTWTWRWLHPAGHLEAGNPIFFHKSARCVSSSRSPSR